MRIGAFLWIGVWAGFVAAFEAGCSNSDATAKDIDAGVPHPSTTADGGDPDAAVLGITLTPLTLVPSFSPSIHDYTVRCAAGDNALRLTVTDESGSQSTAVDAVEGQEIDVRGQYWIRCLPHDFPPITVTTHPDAGAPTPGWYLADGSNYAFVLDTNGTPVWYAAETAVGNVDALTVDTISFLGNWTGPFITASPSQFELHALDSMKTTTVTTVGSPTDGHEFRLLPNGDHLLFTYPIESGIDLTGLQTFGAGETMADCQIQDVDASGNLVWSWLASDHIDPVQESTGPTVDKVGNASVVDVFHCNSIDVDATGNLLLSARQTNAIFYVDRTTGEILWKIGGSTYSKDGEPRLQVVSDPETAFNLQHDARWLPNGDITLFDDHGATPGIGRGVEYAIDHDANTATFVFQFLGSTQSQYAGSFRRYADGSSVIGWGSVPTDPRILTEIDAKGADVLDVSLGGQVSYRAVKVAISQLDIATLRATAGK